MVEEKIKIEAIKTVQPGGTFYTFTIDSNILKDIVDVIRRKEKADGIDTEGFQRQLSKARLESIGRFIDRPNAMFANNIIINFDVSVEFKEEDSSGKGTLIIPLKKCAWMVDGQHRTFGFDFSTKNFPVIVTASIGMPVSKAADLFVTINKEQKGVNPSLVYDILDISGRGEKEEKVTHDIIRQLNTRDDSPWHHQIKMLGSRTKDEKKELGSGLVSQSQMMVKIVPMLNDGSIWSTFDTDGKVDVLINYFAAIKEIFSDDWGSKKSVLTKTLGVSALFNIFSHVVSLCFMKNDYSIKNFKEKLKGLEGYDWSSASKGGLSGIKGQQVVTIELRKMLPEMVGVSIKKG
jgi:DGQHR domain-containing protein